MAATAPRRHHGGRAGIGGPLWGGGAAVRLGACRRGHATHRTHHLHVPAPRRRPPSAHRRRPPAAAAADLGARAAALGAGTPLGAEPAGGEDRAGHTVPLPPGHRRAGQHPLLRRGLAQWRGGSRARFGFGSERSSGDGRAERRRGDACKPILQARRGGTVGGAAVAAHRPAQRRRAARRGRDLPLPASRGGLREGRGRCRAEGCASRHGGCFSGR
mmetsp:Transcript_14910/g.52315  ORF Transcript_14910/g.52315 Transcript_14910/m.52315 type:complete len:216 (+) Transcript_14910:1666-2313(+)